MQSEFKVRIKVDEPRNEFNNTEWQCVLNLAHKHTELMQIDRKTLYDSLFRSHRIYCTWCSHCVVRSRFIDSANHKICFVFRLRIRILQSLNIVYVYIDTHHESIERNRYNCVYWCKAFHANQNVTSLIFFFFLHPMKTQIIPVQYWR